MCCYPDRRNPRRNNLRLHVHVTTPIPGYDREETADAAVYLVGHRNSGGQHRPKALD
jgi:hypothetical protein